MTENHELQQFIADFERRISARVGTLTQNVDSVWNRDSEYRQKVSNTLGKMSSDLEHLAQSQIKIESAVDRVVENQLSCDARAQHREITKRLEKLERKQSDTTIKLATIRSKRNPSDDPPPPSSSSRRPSTQQLTVGGLVATFGTALYFIIEHFVR